MIWMYILAGLAVLLACDVAYRRWSMKELGRRRGSYSVEDFARDLDIPCSERIARSVYTHFQGVAEAPDFPVRPLDDLYEVYRLDDEGVEDEVRALFDQCSLSWPPTTWEEPVVTVRDVVKLLTSEEAKQRAASEALRPPE
jgi:hypothetical protein